MGVPKNIEQDNNDSMFFNQFHPTIKLIQPGPQSHWHVWLHSHLNIFSPQYLAAMKAGFHFKESWISYKAVFIQWATTNTIRLK